MYKDYQEAICRYFEEKKRLHEIPLSLQRPTPAKLKAESLRVYTSRYHKKDDHTLRAFFGDGKEGRTMKEQISASDIDRFRPLVKFLHKQTRQPDDVIYELLAWLIDFPLRPFQESVDYTTHFVETAASGKTFVNNPPEGKNNGTYKKYKETEEPLKNAEDEPGAEETNEADPVVTSSAAGTDAWEKRPHARKLLLFLLLPLLLASGIYFFYQPEISFKAMLKSDHPCMIWMEDHYETVPCEPRYGFQVISREEQLVKLRRIDRPDTITERSIGKIGYISRANKKEFYTGIGPYPEEPHRNIRPLSKLIYTKYVVPLRKE